MAGVVADRVIVELEAKLDRYNANVRAAEARFDTATRNISRSAKQLETSISRNTGAIGNQLRALASTFAAAFTVQQVARLADTYTRFTNQLKVAGLEGDLLARKQEQLFAIGQKYGVSIESLGGLYGRLSQGAKELGASNQQLLQFTNGVAAALKVQGGSAADTRGAIQQLTQALGGQIVRAEEFNSINEGARPILQAVANGIDRFGGSVSKLRGEVIKGKVTSQEFFQGFLKGSADLEAKASKASLTISASFEILNNALGMFIGKTDDSLSATERFSQGIILLSKNLDTVATALGLIAAILIGRFAAGMIRSAATAGVVSTALFAVQARAAGAATSLEALALAGTTAGRSLLAVFGGPIGAAVTALTVGVYYLATSMGEGAQASGEYAVQQEKLRQIHDRVTDATDKLAGATGRARAEAIANAQAVRQETIQYLANARAALIAARAKAKSEQLAQKAAPAPGMGSAGTPGMGFNPSVVVANTNATVAAQNVANAEKELKRLDTIINAPPPVVAPSGGGGDGKKKKKGPKGPKGPDPDEIARRFADDMERGALAYAEAQADVTGTLAERAALEYQRIEADRAMNARAIKADKDLSEGQRQQLLVLNDQIADAQRAAQKAKDHERHQADELALATAGIDNERDLLDAQSRLVDSTKARRDIDLRLLDLQYEKERLELTNIAENTRLNDTDREIARLRLAKLKQLKAADVASINRQAEGPGAQYLRGLNAEDLNDQLERVRVDGLRALEDQLTSTISKVFKLGGAFGQIANQIISDLIRIAVQRAIIQPLANMMFGPGQGAPGAPPVGGGGGGGIMGFLTTAASVIGQFGGFGGGTPARASGGHVSAGQIYKVNENGVEGFQPAGSGQIIPLGRMRRGGGGGTVVKQTFVLDARYGITTPELLQHVKRTANNAAAQGAVASFRSSMENMPRRLDKLNKLGT